MIRRWLARRRQAAQDRAAGLARDADRFIAFNGGDLHRAFWRAHDRWRDPDLTKADRRRWLDLMSKIDARRPPSKPRADTATRMLYRDLDL